MAIASGQCDAALVVGVETMTHAPTAQTTAALNCAMDNENDGPSGLTFPGLFGLAWRIHADRYGTTREQVSAVVRKNKANGLLNPLAQMGASLTDEQIAASASICDPLQLYDCCPASDGAAALVLIARDRVGEAAGVPVDVLATVQTRGASRIAGHPDLCSFDAPVARTHHAPDHNDFAVRVGAQDAGHIEVVGDDGEPAVVDQFAGNGFHRGADIQYQRASVGYGGGYGAGNAGLAGGVEHFALAVGDVLDRRTG
jgi:acetyl-CoA acetyltransferase